MCVVCVCCVCISKYVCSCCVWAEATMPCLLELELQASMGHLAYYVGDVI